MTFPPKLLRYSFSLILFTSMSIAPLFAQSIESPSKSIKVRVIKENVGLYLKPSFDSPIIRNLPIGVSLDFIERVSDYMKVKLPPDDNGLIITGYIRADSVEVELDTLPSAIPNNNDISQRPEPVRSQVPLETMDYTDWKMKLDKAKNNNGIGIATLVLGVLNFAIVPIRGDEISSGQKTLNLVMGTIGVLIGTGVIIDSSNTIRELKEKGIREGYVMSLKIMPTFMNNSAGFLFSFAITF